MAVELDIRPRWRGRLQPGRSDPGAASARSGHRWRRRLLNGVAGLLVLFVIGVVVLLALVPSAESAPSRVRAILSSHSAPSDGGVVPIRLGEALLATEDSRFRSDWAIDPQGTLRALWGVVTSNPNEGGATIEVQLAKLLYTPRRADPGALLEQLGVAIKLDHDFSKNRILAMYLDAAYFGDGAYGVTQAAEHYFGVAPDQLSWGQATLIAGLVQAPSAYDPNGHLSVALARRAHVLARLVAVGTLTPAQVRAIGAEPLNPVVPFHG